MSNTACRRRALRPLCFAPPRWPVCSPLCAVCSSDPPNSNTVTEAPKPRNSATSARPPSHVHVVSREKSNVGMLGGAADNQAAEHVLSEKKARRPSFKTHMKPTAQAVQFTTNRVNHVRPSQRHAAKTQHNPGSRFESALEILGHAERARRGVPSEAVGIGNVRQEDMFVFFF